MAPKRMYRAVAWGVYFVFSPSCEPNRGDVRAAPVPPAPAAAPVTEVAPTDRVDAPTPKAALAALRAEWLITMPVEGFRDARVTVPQGATEPRPVVVALHGAGDRPEWA